MISLAVGGGGFDSIFESIFGRSGGGFSFNQQQGSDVLFETSVTLEDVLMGKKWKLIYKNKFSVIYVMDLVANLALTRKHVSTCNGQGQVRQSRNMGFASFVTAAPCSSCRGQGSIIENPCNECKGQGKKKGMKKVIFEIPPGIDSGDYTVPGEGNEVPNGSNGDLIVRVRVQPHSQFNTRW